MDLPVLRSGERMDYKRCEAKWFWRWRKGYVPRAIKFGALDLGIWMHEALSLWYANGYNRMGKLADLFNNAADRAINEATASGAPEYIIDSADELAALGFEMARAYQKLYGDDEQVNVLATETSIEFSFTDPEGKPVAKHRLTPDMVYADSQNEDDVWLMENKTAASISTAHLVIDDQARPYGAMADRALRNAGIISGRQRLKGIMYNYLRKGLPDERETNAAGKALNKDGTVSKRQPNPLFVRHPVTLTTRQKVIALKRLQDEVFEITTITRAIRAQGKSFDMMRLGKTPHKSCVKFCDFFAMCVVQEQGGDIQEMERTMFRREDPYAQADTTEEPTSFEMG